VADCLKSTDLSGIWRHNELLIKDGIACILQIPSNLRGVNPRPLGERLLDNFNDFELGKIPTPFNSMLILSVSRLLKVRREEDRGPILPDGVIERFKLRCSGNPATAILKSMAPSINSGIFCVMMSCSIFVPRLNVSIWMCKV
jgi:hypothetical protein